MDFVNNSLENLDKKKRKENIEGRRYDRDRCEERRYGGAHSSFWYL